MGRELQFYCTHRDVRLSILGVRYDSAIHLYPSYSEVACLSPILLSQELDESLDLSEQYFLALPGDVGVKERRVVRKDGTAVLMYDQLNNDDGVGLKIGRRIGNLLTPGSVSTLGKTPTALALFGAIRSAFTRKCGRIGGYWVGADAAAILRAGGRLTIDPSAERKWDLRDA